MDDPHSFTFSKPLPLVFVKRGFRGGALFLGSGAMKWPFGGGVISFSGMCGLVQV